MKYYIINVIFLTSRIISLDVKYYLIYLQYFSSMNFIEIDIPNHYQNQNLMNQFFTKISNTLSYNSISTIRQQTPQIIQISILEQTNSINQIITHLKFNFFTHYIVIRFSLLNKQMFRAKTQYQKTFILRELLKLAKNKPRFKFNINPLNGQIFNQITVSIPLIYNFRAMQQFILVSLDTFCKESYEQYKNLFDLLNMEQNSSKKNYNKDNEACNQIKNYIANSSYYAWFVMKKSTSQLKKTSKEFAIYDQTKKMLLDMKKQIKQSVVCKMLTLTYPDSIQQKNYKLFEQQQDSEITKKYLMNGLFNAQKTQIKHITLNEETLKKIKKDNLNCKINCVEEGDIYVRIKKIKQFTSRQYQLSLISQLPQQQFSNIPRYFLIKNEKQFNRDYQITNLYQVISIQKFIESNKQSISIQTKLSLLLQITLFLRYLRDNNQVYHNLLPRNIFIKRALVLKATDFLNMYSFNMNSKIYNVMNQISCKNKFPYVCLNHSTKYKTYNDERADVYSYGMFSYWLLFGKPIVQIKQQCFSQTKQPKQLNQDNIKKKIFTGYKSPIEIAEYENHDIFKLFVNLILKCSNCWTKPTPKQQKQDNQEQLMLDQRPYLDWVIIITKYTLNQYQYFKMK